MRTVSGDSCGPFAGRCDGGPIRVGQAGLLLDGERRCAAGPGELEAIAAAGDSYCYIASRVGGHLNWVRKRAGERDCVVRPGG